MHTATLGMFALNVWSYKDQWRAQFYGHALGPFASEEEAKAAVETFARLALVEALRPPSPHT